MKPLIVCLSIVVLCTLPYSFSRGDSTKIAIIKADDVWNRTPKWDRFFEISQEKGVKVSAGVICNSLAGNNQSYEDWLRELHDSGWVEFWNHGWDHKRWTTDEDVKFSEFGGTGYAHQKKHFDDAQAIMKHVFGKAPIAFGSPYNACDADTLKVMNEDPDLRLFFCYGRVGLKDKVLARMHLRGENDGTGEPNFKKFKAAYRQENERSFSALQFHPNSFSDEHFVEYAKILDFLIARGWTFMQPAEYVATMTQAE
ncbi:MAG: peptidoglycan/xylan/chitin deacetylase (PgdA/CDA1 family) [Candidatus Omnitrophota bacterium]|jgi:peptidoglycan/xylan/chitin deacetylase (PgdA/CDA1 family)